jgi:hypothetical protein
VAERGKSRSRLGNRKAAMEMNALERFIHSENIKNFNNRLKTVTDAAQRTILRRLLANEVRAERLGNPKLPVV